MVNYLVWYKTDWCIAPVKWSWTVHEWFLEQFMCSSWTLIHEQFMNYPWTWNGQVHEVGEVHELGVHKFEFMNLWVHELFMNYSSWIVHELLVHDLFMNNLKKWYMNSSGIVHEHLFMNSSWIDQLDHVMIMWPMIVMWSRPSPLPNLENLNVKVQYLLHNI